jgi:AcrR family transcriptional regulator
MKPAINAAEGRTPGAERTYMRSDDRRRQILGCAKKVFAERGYHAANVSHICAEAGIGRGTLYLYFENKRAVFEAILRETLDRVQALMRVHREKAPPMPAPEQISMRAVLSWNARRFREILGVLFEDQRTLRILLREAVGLDLGIDQVVGEIDDVFISIVERDILAAQEAGFVRPLDARVAATLVVGGVEKLALRALRGDAPVDLDALAREVTALHARGILSERVRD